MEISNTNLYWYYGGGENSIANALPFEMHSVRFPCEWRKIHKNSIVLVRDIFILNSCIEGITFGTATKA